MPKAVNIICDYAPGDLAWSEILTRLNDEIDRDARIITTSVAPFDTIATGFVLAQLAGSFECPPPSRRVLFANCAPRKDKASARQNNEGEGLVYARLDAAGGRTGDAGQRGAELLVVNSGHSLSFVKPLIKRLYTTKASARGSQFRSRDNFPTVLASCLKGDYQFLLSELDVGLIPDVPQSVVAYVDSFGNIKTSIRSGDPLLDELEEGNHVRVIVGDKRRYATVTNGSFNVPEGELAFAPGSSGYDRPFWELFKRGGSAFEEFSRPPSGTRVEIEPA